MGVVAGCVCGGGGQIYWISVLLGKFHFYWFCNSGYEGL